MFDIVALGEALIDFTPSGKNEFGYPMFSQNPGGAPANVLAMASRLGATTSFIGKVGNDSFGRFLKKNISGSGVGTEGLVLSEKYPTTLAFVSLDENGDRSFSFFRNGTADVMLETGDVLSSLLSSCRIFHFGSVSMTDEPSRGTTFSAVREAKKNGALISYDPNFRPLLWKNRKEAVKVMLDAVKYSDILKVSDDELELLAGTSDEKKGSLFLSSLGPAVVMVTMGEKGSFVRKGDYTKEYETISVNAVDTTGAGDTFLGTLLYELILKNNINERRNLESISEKMLDEAMLKANIAGSLSTEKKGAIPSMPKAEDIIAIWERIR